MKSFSSKVLSYAFAHKIITSVIILVVIIEGVAIARGAGTVVVPSYTLTPVRLGTVSETVTGTGQVEGADQVDITPKGSGQVTAIKVKPGDMVAAGQVLVTLDETSALLSLSQAKASLESAQANYEKLVDGLTPQQQALDQAAVTNAEQSLITQLISAYNNTNNTIRTNIDDMFIDPQNDPTFSLTFLDSSGNVVTFNTTDLTIGFEVDGERAQLNSILPLWSSDISSLNLQATSTNIDSHVTLALQNLQYVENFLNNISGAVYGIYAQNSKYQSNLDSYKSSIASAISSVTGSLSSLTNANQSLITANAQYAQDVAPPLSEDVASSQASVDQAQASLQSAQDAYNNNLVTAPFAGEIAAVDVEPGDIAGGSTVVATITTTDKIADISLNEVDAATVNVGDPAILTFSALPNVNVPAHVAEMALVGTVSSGVVDYNVKLSIDPVATSTATTSPFGNYSGYAGNGLGGRFGSSTSATSTATSSSPGRFSGGGFGGAGGSGVSATPSIPFTAAIYNEIKPGMSVTASIVTASHRGVLVVPSIAIKTLSNGLVSYVQTLAGVTATGTVTTDSVPQSIQVTTGLTNGTQTEITSGLTEGQLIISKTTNASKLVTAPTAAAAATTRIGGGGFGAGGGFGGGGGAAVARAL
jgi:HlyD family secretion protein